MTARIQLNEIVHAPIPHAAEKGNVANVWPITFSRGRFRVVFSAGKLKSLITDQ